jgi:hypothetical protein
MPKKKQIRNSEQIRLEEKGKGPVPMWQKWGPYVSERSWGTVREDYSATGEAWSYFTFDQAHYKAYRWGEDGIAGWCDRYQILVFSPSFWNGKDWILKERLFGLSSPEGNHGEDVKEYYYYLDGVPSHAYMKYLYKYPQEEFPYHQLREENAKRTTQDPEYELIDTGIFNENRYFDIFIEYAKSSSEETLIKIEAFNRSKHAHDLHVIPQIWFRNQWSWTPEGEEKPQIYLGKSSKSYVCLVADDSSMPSPSNLSFEYKLGKRYLYGPPGATCLFTNNETRFHGHEKPGEHYKDAFHEHIVRGKDATNPNQLGTKACLHYFFPKVAGEKSICLYLRLSDKQVKDPLKGIAKIFSQRKKETDRFYAGIHPKKATLEEKKIQRQALAGLLWNKQIYLYDVGIWLKGDNPNLPPPLSRHSIRNVHWKHLNSMRIFSMPDKWEYPWFAAWDQAYHCVIWGLLDIEFAKEQLWLLLFDQFQHPNGQIPSYEWEFSDLNPPLQGWAALQLFRMEKKKKGKGDLEFLERCFHKLLMNFSWWVNKVDSSGNNVFEGGFLGLDNITVLDRSQRLPKGVTLQQSDGTGWMAFFCLNLMRIALELSPGNKVYESLATKFFEHYVYIAQAMIKKGDKNIELWDEQDGFFYDVLRHPNGSFSRFQVRSLVGIIPLFAVEYLRDKDLKKFPSFYRDLNWFLKNRKQLVAQSVIIRELKKERFYVLVPMNVEQLQSILRYVWNPKEFRSQYGLRSLSKYHESHPFEFEGKKVCYEPAESQDRIKGGNSNWRGPVWTQLTFLLILALRRLAFVFDKELKIAIEGEDPVYLEKMAKSFSERLISIYTLDNEKNRPFLGKDFPYKNDPNWNQYFLFHEYFDAETGKGLGASHQSGWTSLVANLINYLRSDTFYLT